MDIGHLKVRYMLIFMCITLCSSQETNVRESEKKTVSKNQKSVNTYLPREYILSSMCQIKQEILNISDIEALEKSIHECNIKNVPKCDGSSSNKYRSFDGSCNNLKYPNRGKLDTCVERILPYDYGDNVSTLRMSTSGKNLPNARHVSNVLHRETSPTFGRFTTFYLVWGQMFAHDLSMFRSNEEIDEGIKERDCCVFGPVIDDKCLSIAVPKNDPFYSNHVRDCLSSQRSRVCECNIGKRVHLISVSSFQDLSHLYGNSEKESKTFRSFIRGMLSVDYNPTSGEIPKPVLDGDECNSIEEDTCVFKTGDPRDNQNPWILTAHIFLLRYHNKICEELYKVHRDWSDEKLFQEARRIFIAQAQFITYASYLPLLIGKLTDVYGIAVSPNDVNYTKYDPEVNPSMLDEYATVASRYGHSMIPWTFSEVDPETGERGELHMRDFYFRPREFRYGFYEKIVRGMGIDRVMKNDLCLSDDTRNYLYKNPNETTGRDLASLSILRGREHGVPGYTYYQKFLNGNTIKNFDDLIEFIPKQDVDNIKKVYECVHDIDLYVGGLAEFPLPKSLVGPTFGAILGEQYRRLKFGDRYWFEHEGQAGSFTPEQLREIKKSSLARIICDTSSIDSIQRFPFQVVSKKNPTVPCKEIIKIDYSVF